jgi:hypothetical protein
MVHFNIGSRHILVQPRGSSTNVDWPEKPSMFDLTRTAVRLGVAGRVLGLGNRAAALGGRAAMMNPRLTATVMRRALPDMPWERRWTMPWQARQMPWQARSRAPWWAWRRLGQPSRSMPWLAAGAMALPWMREERRMPWQSGRHLPARRGRRDGGAQAWQLLLAAAAGALAVYLLDPEQGNRRRKMAAQRFGHISRTAARSLARTGRRLGATLAGKRQMLLYGGRSHEALDDATLAHKVESVLFRDPHIPKGNININSEHGVVVLHGEVQSPDELREIERRVRDIDGVQDVRSMLHLVHTPGP